MQEVGITFLEKDILTPEVSKILNYKIYHKQVQRQEKNEGRLVCNTYKRQKFQVQDMY